MAKGDKWERKELLKEFQEKHGFSVEDADSLGRTRNETVKRISERLDDTIPRSQYLDDIDIVMDAFINREAYRQALETKGQDYFLTASGSFFFAVVGVLQFVSPVAAGGMLSGAVIFICAAWLGFQAWHSFHSNKVDDDVIDDLREAYLTSDTRLDLFIKRMEEGGIYAKPEEREEGYDPLGNKLSVSGATKKDDE